MKAKIIPILVVTAIVAIVMALMLLALESCQTGPPYEVVSTRSSDEPEQFIVLNSTQIQSYPIIDDVIDAFDNQEDHPGARFTGGSLYYAVYEEREVGRADDYIIERYRNEHSSPIWYPMNIAYDKGDGQGTQFYTWEVIAIDYSRPFYCP